MGILENVGNFIRDGVGDLLGFKSQSDAINANEDINSDNLDWAREQYYDSKDFLRKQDKRAYLRQGRLNEQVQGFTQDNMRLANKWNRKASRKDWQRQKTVLKKGTGWQMRDAMNMASKHGIHKLAALGVPGASYSGAMSSQSGGSPGSGGSPTGTGAVPVGSDPQQIPAEANPYLGDMLENVSEKARARTLQEQQYKLDQADLDIRKKNADNLAAQTALLQAQSRTEAQRTRRLDQDISSQDQEDENRTKKGNIVITKKDDSGNEWHHQQGDGEDLSERLVRWMDNLYYELKDDTPQRKEIYRKVWKELKENLTPGEFKKLDIDKKRGF